MSTTLQTAKEQMIDVLRRQPDDSSYEELLRELAFERMVERGLDELDRGQFVTHEAVLTEMKSWET